MRKSNGPSLTQDIYEQLRSQILHGEFGPGDRLHISHLASDFGVSLGVVREAVTRLGSERLVEAIPQSGFRVRGVSAKHLSDLSDARCLLEVTAITEAIAHGDTRWEADVVAAHHLLKVTPLRLDDGEFNPGWMSAHLQFHATLAAGCDNAILLALRQQLFDEGELYRHRAAQRHDVQKQSAQRNIAEEHDALVEAVIQRDPARAANVIEEHLRSTQRELAESFTDEASAES